MALVVKDRVQEATSTSGTGTLTFSGPIPGYQDFSTAIGNGNTTFYTIYDSVAQVWEVGIGTVGAGTLSRDIVLSNSSGTTSLISLAGNSSNVFCTYPAEKSVNLDSSGNVSPLGTISSGTWQGSTVGVSYGGTGVTASSGANSVVLRDANQNSNFNRISQTRAVTTAAGGSTALTDASAFVQTLVGTGTQDFTLPDATTLVTGTWFLFDNDATSNLVVKDFAGAIKDTIASGGYTLLILENNSTVAGYWIRAGLVPSEVNWGTNSLDLGGSTIITNGTWEGDPVDSAYGGTGLTTFSAANYALYSTSASALTAGTLPVAAGGTGDTTFTSNGVLYGNGTSPISVTAAGTTGQVLIGNTGSAPTWGAIPSTAAVTSFQTSLSGLTPNTATTGAVTLAGTLGVTSGGTGTSTAFTTGSVIFAGASGTYTQDNANFFWDDTNNSLGIGTNTPRYLSTGATALSVAGSTSVGSTLELVNTAADASNNQGTISFVATGNTSSEIARIRATTSGITATNRGGTLDFSVKPDGVSSAPVSAMFIDNTGNVGVGTTSPSWQLTQYTTSRTRHVLQGATANTGTQGADTTWYDGTTAHSIGFQQSIFGTGGSSLCINAGNSQAMTFTTSNTEAMRIDSSGNVGIGTSTTTGKLTVSKSNGGNVSGAANAAIYLDQDESTIQGPGTYTNIRMGGNLTLAANTLMALNTNNTERMRIDSNGNVGIGVTPAGTGLLELKAGTATVAPIELASGTNLTTPVAGTIEYDGAVQYFTNDTTSARGFTPNTQIFRLAANVTAFGPAIGNFFGANSAINLAAGGVYEIQAYCRFTKTTAGTVTVTATTSAAPVNLSGTVQYGAITGGTATGAANQISLYNSTATAAAFGASGSLTTAVSHTFIITLLVEANASASNLRINFTQSAGTVTPLRTSYYKVTRLPATNTGSFAA